MPTSDQRRTGSRMSEAAPSLWRVPLLAAQVPETGQEVHLSADEETRAAVARAAGIDRVDALEADLSVGRHGREGLRVTGTVSGRVGQTCVVTLEPVDNVVREPVDLVFVAPEETARSDAGPPLADGETDQPPDPPEELVAGAVDLGAIAVEFLILGLDPYPRKQGVQFEGPAPKDDPALKPFAALAALKNRKNDREI